MCHPDEGLGLLGGSAMPSSSFRYRFSTFHRRVIASLEALDDGFGDALTDQFRQCRIQIAVVFVLLLQAFQDNRNLS